MTVRPDHGLLLGLRDDDHPQYYDDARLAAYLTANPPVPAAHTHLEADVTDLGNYSVVGHGHTESDISDFGNYSVVGHGHTESDISDLGSYLPLGGGTVTGQLDLSSGGDTPLRFTAASGPSGLGFSPSGVLAAQLVYRTSPGVLQFEDSVANSVIELATGGGTDTRGVAVDGRLIPIGNNTVDLGADGAEWKDLWLRGRLYMGGETTDYIEYDPTNEHFSFWVNGVESLRIDNAGRMLKSKPLGCDAYRSTGQSFASSTSYVTMDVPTELYDSAGNLAADTFTVPTDGEGFYIFGAQARFTSTVAGDVQKICVLHSNGFRWEAWNDEATAVLNMTAARYLSAGETLKPQLAQSSGDSRTTYANSQRFWVVRVT